MWGVEYLPVSGSLDKWVPEGGAVPSWVWMYLFEGYLGGGA